MRGAVRPPWPPRAASHRRGKILSTFRELGILPETAEALEAVGITSPFPIQEMTLPVALSGSDVIGQAKTGTGKTLGFGLPLLERVTVPADVEAGRAKPEQLTEAPQALVVVPTRELCQQVTNDLLTAGKVRNVRVLSIYGGRAYEPQVEALKKGVDVVVGTPGRLLDLAGQKKLNLSHVKALVLDEADEMLDLGFLPDVERIINMLPARRQTMLFSATMPGAVIGLARRYMSQPTHIRAAAPDDQGKTVANIKQHVFRAHSMDKPELVSRILQADGRGLAMIFCRTKRTAADIAEQLTRRGFAAGAVHGDLGQGAREQALRAFRNGKVDVLVCTDVAARGIDVEGVTHVINYQTPEDEKTYLHRIGRTGRAGAKGTAVTLVDWDDIPRWKLINKALDLPFDEPEETYSTSPHLYELLEIPEGTKGILPRAERTRAGLAAEEVEDLGETGGRGRGPRRGAPAVEEERPSRTRTPRQRRRTRGGAPLDESGTPAASGSPAASGTAEGGSAATDGPRQPRRRRRTRGGSGGASSAAVTPARDESIASEAAQADATAAPSKPRRRRTRGGANGAAKAEAAGTTASVAVDTAEDAAATVKVPAQATAEATVVTEAPAVTEPAEAPAKSRRRTRSAKPAAETAVETAESVAAAPEAVAETVADEAPAKPRRTRKTAAKKTGTAAEAVEAAAETVAEEAPAKPRRTRKTAAKKAEAAVDTAEAAEAVAEEAPAKPRRTRKTAAKKAEAAVDTAEGTEAVAETAAEEAPAKPRRTRKTAAKKTEAAAEPVAEEAAAKPRRTRKTAAKKAEAAVDAAEGTQAVAETAADEAAAKPRRTRKTAAAKKAEAAVDTAEAVAEEAPAKPRRTRKTAAEKAEATAEAAEPSAEEAAAKPRRTRKATAAKAEAAPAADEAPAKPRRTRKTAAKKVTAEAPAEG
ncbi:DEAD/DEAH box helicase [Streptomyces rimosus subsp. rimosus ATCC 10970]|uniref:RNA helicase n=3 Tax=Streptomyces TaxID=1883 RepID=A0A8A1USX5_STRR1|nr:DEAD/DEAH box helicase [Streptomyces rimosus]QGY69746.1 DEAD/DEAH box helicase [Streptomyces rimosus R6-500]QDA04633.1 ATP-dependent helicase [Streptomyces rimosus]QEV75920.1 DEAD/DEAH box helicase [Streptomyces rimosus]QST83330.1 DEAD/DEAH box helicase [Streptomyces rimosus subsp. rimosus ATCC 10970]QTL86736.1 DEAD/DEAH box helicase [Streptomyces rimosus subsp. rimosus]